MWRRAILSSGNEYTTNSDASLVRRVGCCGHCCCCHIQQFLLVVECEEQTAAVATAITTTSTHSNVHLVSRAGCSHSFWHFHAQWYTSLVRGRPRSRCCCCHAEWECEFSEEGCMLPSTVCSSAGYVTSPLVVMHRWNFSVIKDTLQPIFSQTI